MDQTTLPDPYRHSGEFLDVLSQDAWRILRDPVRAALRGATPAAPVVDLGAGSGLGALLAAEGLPGAEIIAVEPSSVQRAVLLARVVGDPDLRRRVTVVAADAESVDLPDRIGAAMAINMIGHLAPDARRKLWRRLADRMAAGAPLVVNAQPPAEAAVVPEVVFASVRVGRLTYEGSGSAEPAGTDAVTWHMRYRVTDDSGRTVRDLRAAYHWHVVSVPSLREELAAAGFGTEDVQHDVLRTVRKG